MCGVSPDGYVMRDGTIVSFRSKLDEINPRYIDELAKTPATAWEFLQIKSALHKLGNDIQVHQKGCPINEVKIRQISEEVFDMKIKDYPSQLLERSSNKAKHITNILDLAFKVAVVIAVLYTVFKV